ncbi:gliding motility-associated C-terminal domain-containing protein [Spirosoma utsteinense]|uniref:Gliding motility-associated-like protein n=1 Tax=Spirosoma utsteinense TaxID=2585773 RepID=A0ABR6WDP2_9BACT|nr:gliding motility-associated C-terminal domain-containing protein [Spirosoma utsteinense]MBC3788840.1 gliding motility-associated-like protein [Spirosoma utsteinense]MBC3794125.1 gliding motility-associated-like protein [Spirosoma utsteinense]
MCKEVTVLPLDPVKFTAKACSGRQALVDVQLDASTSQYDSYVINWGDGQNSNPLTRAEIATQQAHTYGNAGVYSIRITGRYAAPASCETPLTASQSTLQTVTVSNASAQPAITKLITNSSNSISIDYQAGTGVAVELYQKDASGIFSSTRQRGTGSGTFSVQTNATQVQCFQLVAQDACNNAGQRSDEVCSLVIDAKAGNKRNDVSWQPYAGAISAGSQFRRYRIYRNSSPLITLLDRNIANHVDINKVECGTQYCYTLEATITGTVETVVTSAPVCVTGINGDLPGNFESVIVSVESGRPRLVASLPITGTSSSYTLVVSRASGSPGTFQPIGTVVNRNTFVDSTANTSAGSYCYQLTYLANCGLSSPPSAPVCTVFLGSQSPGSIDWTAPSPFAPGSVVNYTVEVIDSLNGTQREIQAGGNLRFEPPGLNDSESQTQKYRIVAVSNTGRVSYSNFFTLQREATILTPDAFTPNGDGLNEVFIAKGVYADRFSMTIYNRWGEVIYATSDKNQGWDGTASSQPAAAGHYMYRIEVQDRAGLKTVRTGTVLLIR